MEEFFKEGELFGFVLNNLQYKFMEPVKLETSILKAGEDDVSRLGEREESERMHILALSRGETCLAWL